MAEALRAQAAHCDLSVVLQLVSAQWLTGRLLVESERSIEATIRCSEGLPVAASCNRIEGLLAFYEAFLVPQVQLTFFVQDVSLPPEGPFGEVMVLLLEACRRLDEWRGLTRQVLRRDGPLPDEAPAELQPVWQRLDGSCGLAPIVEDLGLVRAAVVDPVRTWLDSGVLSTVDVPEPSPPPSVRPDTVALLARGRAQVRSGDIVGAISSFTEALALDPHHLLAQQHLLRLRELHPRLFHPEDEP